MKIIKEKGSPYLYDTGVENIFISEYMTEAPGDYVKVFLFGLMLSEYGYGEHKISNEQIAKELFISPDDVEKAWLYWEEEGLVVNNESGRIFTCLKEKLYVNHGKKKDVPFEKKADALDKKIGNILNNRPLKEMYVEIEHISGRPLNGSETSEIINWIEQDGATPEIITSAYKYCIDRGKSNVRYVGKVVRNWAGKGFATKHDVEKFLGENDIRHNTYKRVMRALGFQRNVTEEEKRIIDRWLDELSCSMDDILNACGKTSGISNPNINYVNKVLENRNGGQSHSKRNSKNTVSRAEVLDRYATMREQAKREAIKRQKEVYEKAPRIKQIDDEKIDLGMKLSQVLLNGGADKPARIEKIKKQSENLEKEKNRLLSENDIPIDYMNIRYKCNKCQDTGVRADGSVCECWMRIEDEVRKRKS